LIGYRVLGYNDSLQLSTKFILLDFNAVALLDVVSVECAENRLRLKWYVKQKMFENTVALEL